MDLLKEPGRVQGTYSPEGDLTTNRHIGNIPKSPDSKQNQGLSGLLEDPSRRKKHVLASILVALFFWTVVGVGGECTTTLSL